MEKLKKILAPTDLSELSQAGVRYALELASTVGAEVTVYHVVGTDELMHYDLLGRLDHILEKYQVMLDQFLKEHFADLLPAVKVRAKVELGTPDDNIVHAAQGEGADLIVISTHGRTGLAHVMMGSVTERVVRHALCPVLSIRPERDRKAAQKTAAAA